MTMTAPIPLPYATPRTVVEVDIDQLLPQTVIRIPRWVADGVARLECLSEGHHPGRLTLAQDGVRHCLNCGKALKRRH